MKECRFTEVVFKEGKQNILRPTFEKSDENKSSNELLSSVVIAPDRSRNDTAVCLEKYVDMLIKAL